MSLTQAQRSSIIQTAMRAQAAWVPMSQIQAAARQATSQASGGGWAAPRVTPPTPTQTWATISGWGGGTPTPPTPPAPPKITPPTPPANLWPTGTWTAGQKQTQTWGSPTGGNVFNAAPDVLTLWTTPQITQEWNSFRVWSQLFSTQEAAQRAQARLASAPTVTDSVGTVFWPWAPSRNVSAPPAPQPQPESPTPPKFWELETPATDYSFQENLRSMQEQMNIQSESLARQSAEIEKLRQEKNNTVQEWANIIQSRFANVNTSNEQIMDRMRQYEDLAKNLFDQTASQQAYANAMQMAEQGLITNEQVAQMANLSMADYKRNVDLQKSTLEADIQKEYMNIIREKQQAIDAIYQDQSINADKRLQYETAITNAYNNILNNVYNQFQDIQNRFAQTNIGIASPFAAIEAGQQQEIAWFNIQNIIRDMDIQRATMSPQDKYSFLINGAERAWIDTNAVLEIIRQQYNRADFTKRDPVQHLIDVLGQAARMGRRWAGWVGWAGWGWNPGNININLPETETQTQTWTETLGIGWSPITMPQVPQTNLLWSNVGNSWFIPSNNANYGAGSVAWFNF